MSVCKAKGKKIWLLKRKKESVTSESWTIDRSKEVNSLASYDFKLFRNKEPRKSGSHGLSVYIVLELFFFWVSDHIFVFNVRKKNIDIKVKKI